MSDHFNNHGRAASEEPTSLSSELQLIPRWSVAAAALSFVGVLYLFMFVVPQHEHHQAPFGLHLYFSLSWSALSALYMLMVGYITRDSRRRAMHARLWIIVCLVLPGGIGAVLYFLLRRPVITPCPACGTRVQTEFHFCPQCAYQLSASCARCFKSMDIADRFCVECGYDRSRESTPNRLYAFRDEA
jgi:hypothetical protein